MALLALIGRRVAISRANASGEEGTGQLHVRFVALFSLISSIPMLLVVVITSLLFQYGVEFWFSDRARTMLENANDLARGYYEEGGAMYTAAWTSGLTETMSDQLVVPQE